MNTTKRPGFAERRTRGTVGVERQLDRHLSDTRKTVNAETTRFEAVHACPTVSSYT
jgi:hypothetical protein